MLKKLFLILTLCVVSNANINVAVQNMIGNSDYNTHKNLINHIFSNRSSYYLNGQVDYARISQELENKGLIKLNLGSVQDIEVTFYFNTSPKKSIKNITDILKTIGQQNFITKEEVVVDNQLKWTIKLKTAAAISPLRLSQELQSINCRIMDIRREGNNKWSYSIDTSASYVYKAEDLSGNSQLSLKKPSKPYMIRVSDISKINIYSNAGNSWYPSIVFYDNNFNTIEVIEKDSLHTNLKIDVPNNTNYIKIDDFYSLGNIKRGLNITKE